jgi:radical SAM protein with 4Fe4S-binding SPASM domain
MSSHDYFRRNPLFAREVALSQVLKSLTLKRVLNVVKISVSFLLSILFRREFVWGLPPILNVEPTNICNLKCPLCTTGCGQMERPPGRMNFDLFKKIVDEVADRIVYITLYHQGEPYLVKDFNRFVVYAKKQGVYVNTSTNAHFFTAENARNVVQSGLDSVIISLDGVTQETYEHYRTGGSLEKVLQGIRNLVAAKDELGSRTPYLFLQFLVMRHNEHEIPAIRRLARELRVDRLLIKTIQVNTHEEAREWLPHDERYRRYRVDQDGLRVKRGKGSCPRVWFTSLVDWDGQVVPCCFDKNGEYAMGDLNKGDTFERIWRSAKYSAFRKRMLKKRDSIDICQNCNYGIGLFK